MMKKRVLCTSIIILGILLGGVSLGRYFSSDAYIREKYPYCIDGHAGFDPVVYSELSLKHLTGSNDAVIHGKFTGEREREQVSLLPDVRSNRYSGYCNMAETKGVSVEEVISEMGYDRFLFQIEDVILDELEWGYKKGDIVEIYVYSGVNTVGYLPKIDEGSEFVIFVDGFYLGENAVYEWNATDCFYVTPWNTIYPYQNTERLNEYSGKTVDYLTEAMEYLKDK